MANEFEHETYGLTMAAYQRALIEQQAAYQRAKLDGDTLAASAAYQEMAALRAQQREAHDLAVQEAAALAPSQSANKYGLSPLEVEVAHASHSAPGVSKEEKARDYAIQKQKLARMKATGEYSINQGSVFK